MSRGIVKAHSSPYIVKQKPNPMPSVIPCRAATPPAPNKQRTRLYAACDVDVLSGFRSVNKVLRTVNMPTMVLPVKTCSTSGTARCCKTLVGGVWLFRGSRRPTVLFCKVHPYPIVAPEPTIMRYHALRNRACSIGKFERSSPFRFLTVKP